MPNESTTIPSSGAEAERIFNVVLGTAGHIDHGKSTLVRALTGIDPDRLKEEKERGITIDIGFAPLQLSNGLRVNIIDVPGHERFIKNMVAGATGIDFVMLVVAADDGVMAQTREHLQIVQLLGVPDGLTVITKIDMVEKELTDIVEDEVRKMVVGTCLDGKPILRYSSVTKEGLDALRITLEQALSGLKRRTSAGPFRQLIQRVFVKEGFGTVLTGVNTSGTIAVGETIEILPPGHQGRVKGLQAYGGKIQRSHAGHSVAINVGGIERQTVTRGMDAVTPGVFRPATMVAAHLLHLSDAPFPLKHRAPVRFLAGTAEIMGKVLLLEHDQVPAGCEAFVQIALEEPMVLIPGDRYILRHQSPLVTLGGGQVLDVAPAKRKRFSPEVIEDLRARRAKLGDTTEFLALVLAGAPGPKSLSELRAEIGLLTEQVIAIVAQLEAAQRAITLRLGELFASTRVFKQLAQTVRAVLEVFFKEHPALGGMPRPELRARLERALEAPAGLPWFDDVVTLLEKSQVIACAGNEVRLAGRERKLDARWAEHARKVEDTLRAGGLMPPLRDEVGRLAQLQPQPLREVLRYLLDSGTIVEATPEVYILREAYDAAWKKTAALFERKPDLTVSEIRQELGLNRKYVMPLVEKFDRDGLTKRVGDVRRRAGTA
jgi:selenocysteine-specific elongation factor